jgi:hypothetical protein
VTRMARHSILNVLLMIVLATFVLPAAARARRKASPDLLGSIFWARLSPLSELVRTGCWHRIE